MPFPYAGVLPHPGIEPSSLVPLALAGRFFTTVPPGEPETWMTKQNIQRKFLQVAETRITKAKCPSRDEWIKKMWYILYTQWTIATATAAAKSLQSCPTLCDPRDVWLPTRLPRPWNSPGKNTGVGCHFLLQRMKVKSESEVAQSCPTLSDPMDCSLPGSSIHGIFQARVLEWGEWNITQP